MPYLGLYTFKFRRAMNSLLKNELKSETKRALTEVSNLRYQSLFFHNNYCVIDTKRKKLVLQRDEEAWHESDKNFSEVFASAGYKLQNTTKRPKIDYFNVLKVEYLKLKEYESEEEGQSFQRYQDFVASAFIFLFVLNFQYSFQLKSL